MVKLSKHTRCELVIGAALLLGSCGSHSPDEAYQLADAARVHAANAWELCDDLDSRVSELEYRLGLE